MGGSASSICPLIEPIQEEVDDHYANLCITVFDVCLIRPIFSWGMDSEHSEAMQIAFVEEERPISYYKCCSWWGFLLAFFFFFRACLDMYNVGMQDDLIVL